MGPLKILNPKGKWKEVQIDPNLYGNAEFENFLSFEELTDYELVKEDLGLKKKKKNKTPDGVADTDKSAPVAKKKKKKLKVKHEVSVGSESGDSEDVSEMSEPQKEDPVTKLKKKKAKGKKQKEKQSDGESTSVISEKKIKKDIKLKGKRGKLVHMGLVEDAFPAEDLELPDSLESESAEAFIPKPKKKKLTSKKRKAKAEAHKSEGPEKKKKKIIVDTEENSSCALPDMSSWKDLFVPDEVLRALAEQGFTAPMPIQTLTLPSACRDRKDIVGAAETGSGKTLAFGIPLLYHILREKELLKKVQDLSDFENDNEEEDDSDEMDGNPDEEEDENNEQVDEDDDDEIVEEEDDDDNVEEEDDDDVEEDDSGAPSSCDEEDLPELEDDEMGCVRAVDNVEFDWLEDGDGKGTETAEKRGKGKSKEMKPLFALVLTPTRELAIQVLNHISNAAKYTGIKAAVVVGGMAPQKQRRVLRGCPEIVVATPGRLWELIREGDPHLSKVADVKYLVIDEADRMIEKGHFAELQGLLELVNRNEEKKEKRQTFVFSATLTMVHSGPARILKRKKQKKKMTSESKLENLMVGVGIKPKPKIVDLTNKIGMAEKVIESRIHCSVEEKDLYLYYLLQQYPGRTLVFCNSKDCVRRLVSVFTLLKCSPLPLHADMHQRQRLKNLDKFRDNPRSLLLATDVAARGLDIPGVEHVVHFQVPRTSENYVHRSGRTARGYSEGLSVILVGPQEQKSYRKILHTLSREDDLPMFPVEDQYLPQLKERVTLARSIDKSEHRQNKMKVENNWFEKAAKEMDMALDEDLLMNDLGDSYSQATQKRAMSEMRAELNSLLSQPVIPRFFSGKYPTKSGKLQIPYMSSRNMDGAASKVKDVRKTQPKNVVNVMRQKKKKQKKRK